MTITKYDRVAILPKRCDKCNRLFWLEPYNIFYETVGIEGYPLKQIECKNCIQNQKWIDFLRQKVRIRRVKMIARQCDRCGVFIKEDLTNKLKMSMLQKKIPHNTDEV